MLSLVVAAALVPLAGLRVAASTGPDDQLLRDGAEVYSAVCSGCHQPGGVGIAGDFPPLVDNPNVADADYVESVIRNGRTGELTVNGETYDGVMPAQSTLTDDDVTAVIAYIQSGFATPAGPVAEVNGGEVAGTDLPLLADFTVIIGLLIAVAAAAMVLGPRIIAANDRREITWVDAWMKTAVIVVGLILLTTVVPARVLEIGAVERLSRTVQDLITVAIWTAALVGSLWALWYAHREKRI